MSVEERDDRVVVTTTGGRITADHVVVATNTPINDRVKMHTHKTGQERNPEDRYAALIAWMREHFPQAGEITHRWSGEVMEPLDGIAYLGRNPGNDRVYVITGDSGIRARKPGIVRVTARASLASAA